MSARRYHVYADDGFESARRSEDAARRAAKRGACRRAIEYVVTSTDAYGLTGGGHGSEVARYRCVDGRAVEVAS